MSQSNLQDRIPRYTTIPLIQHVIIWQKRQHKKNGGNIGNVCRSIDFDIKHGVTIEEVLVFLDKVRNDLSSPTLMIINVDRIGRLNEIQSYFTTSAPASTLLLYSGITGF